MSEVKGQFTVAGLAKKTVVVRALGPSLASSGVAGSISDPVLELRDAAGVLVAQNDNWADTQQAEFSNGGAYAAFRPADSRESALAVDLAPGTYTATIRGQNKLVGTAVLEWDDCSANTDASLSNSKASGMVQTGEDVLVGSITVARGTSKAIIRAIGPSEFPNGTALADPTLELYDSNGLLIASNDNWQDDPANADQITAVGLAPSKASEAALATNLSPGGYTAVVRGKNGATGAATLSIALLP